MTISNGTKKVTAPVKLAHVVLRSNNMDRLAEWYVTFLGGRLVLRNPVISFITYDDEHHRIAIVSMPEIENKIRNSSGLEHIAFTFGSLKELLTAYKERLALPEPIKPVWCVNHRITTSIYYKDPDGNLLETQVDNFGDDVETPNKLMESEIMAKNPMGIDFEPEELLKQLEADGEEATLRALQKPVELDYPRGLDTVPAAYMN